MKGDFTKVVPCGMCVKCLRRRQSGWAFRLYEQMKVSDTAAFITLTYENAPVSPLGYSTLQKRDLQLFWKRVRKALPGYKIKYYACGEYGSRTLRPHYHAIVFNLPLGSLTSTQFLDKTWGHGIVDIGDCTLSSIRYTTKYVMKGKMAPEDYVDTETGEIFEDDREKEFSLMSKGMGLSHLTPAMMNFYRKRMVDYATLPGGEMVTLPRYFKERIFSKKERQLLGEAHALAAEMDFQKIYRNAEHEVKWKRDLIRKTEKLQLQRNAI